MFEPLARFVKGLIDPTSQVAFAPDDARVAAAALLHQAVAVDGGVSEAERACLMRAIGRLFGLDERGARHLLEAGVQAEADAIDPTEFVSALRRKMSDVERFAIVAAMWDLVCVDGQLHEFEEDLVWRIAGPLGISDEDREALRVRALAGKAGGAT
jgi:uncharacterized tellurite resistance protein B-like protein